MNPDDIRDFRAIQHMLDRLGKAIMMSADTEMAEIIRRRLFEWTGMPDEARKTAASYSAWAVEHAQELAGIDADTVQAAFLASYPFHPSLLSVFQRKWQSLQSFQRTRGILRLLALWVSHNHAEEHRKGADIKRATSPNCLIVSKPGHSRSNPSGSTFSSSQNSFQPSALTTKQ